MLLNEVGWWISRAHQRSSPKKLANFSKKIYPVITQNFVGYTIYHITILHTAVREKGGIKILSRTVAYFNRVQKTRFFKKPNQVGFIGFFAGFLFQCAVLDAIHINGK